MSLSRWGASPLSEAGLQLTAPPKSVNHDDGVYDYAGQKTDYVEQNAKLRDADEVDQQEESPRQRQQKGRVKAGIVFPKRDASDYMGEPVKMVMYTGTKAIPIVTYFAR